MEYVQERIATLHAFDDPAPPLPPETAVVVPLLAGQQTAASRDTFTTLETVEPAQVLVPLRGTREDVRGTVRWLDDLAIPVRPIWCNAPAVERILRRQGIDQPVGKGLDVWLALGVAATCAEHVVVHDADNRRYATSHVPRLAWPLANGYRFVKGYYARVESTRLYGRLTRVLCLPLIEAARRQSEETLFEYLGAFRYPLAGEYAMPTTLATQLRLPSNWGLELGMLIEAFEHADFAATAQVDLGRHRHDHRPVSGANGLVAMAEEVIDAFVSGVREAGVSIDWEQLRAQYRRVAEEYLDRYETDAAFNGLGYSAAGERDRADEYAARITDRANDARLPRFAESGIDPAGVRDAGAIAPST